MFLESCTLMLVYAGRTVKLALAQTPKFDKDGRCKIKDKRIGLIKTKENTSYSPLQYSHICRYPILAESVALSAHCLHSEHSIIQSILGTRIDLPAFSGRASAAVMISLDPQLQKFL